MFKFLFREPEDTSQTHDDIHDLDEQDLEDLTGGTPARYLSDPANTPRWIRNTADGLDLGESGSSRYPQVFPGSQRPSQRGRNLADNLTDYDG